MIITREKGMRMWGGGSGSTSASGVNGGGGFSLAVTEGEGTGNAYTGFTYESGVLSLIKGTQFVTTDFFNRLFTAYDANGTAIVPNDTTTAINNLKLMVGTWTEEYLSALGKNSEGGGGGGGIELSDVWQSLRTNTDDYANQKINSAHIPDLSGTYATKTWVNQQGFVTSSGVTSIAMTVPTGLSVSGSPITSTGTLALTFATGYSIPTTAKQSNWDTAYGWGNHATAGYAMAATNIIAGNGLTGGGTIAADRTLSIQLQSNSGLAVSSSGLKLDIINNLTTESAYKAISATQAKKIWDLLNQMFTLEGAGTTASPYVIKANYGLYTEQFLSALGQNSSGGGGGDFDEEQMWTALQSTSGTYATTKIATSHIPDMASTYGYLKASSLNGYATQAWVNQQGFLTTHQSIYALTLKAGGTAVTTFTPNSADASLDFVAGTNISLTRGTNQITIANTYSYTLPLAASGTRGGVQIGYSESNSGTSTTRNYAVKLSSEKMYVNVPWENTTYESKAAASGGTAVSLVTTGEKYTWNNKQDAISDLSTIRSNASNGNTAYGYFTSGAANNVVTTADTTNTLYVVGVTSSATTTLKRDTSITIKGNALSAGSVTTTGNVSIGGTLGVTGATTLSSTLSVAGGITLTTTKKIYFGDTSHYLELDSTGFHFSHGVYSDSFVSALGSNSSGGGSGTFDEEAMWEALGTTSTAKVIASSHIPNLDASKITSGTLAAARIPLATSSARGGVKIGYTTNGKNYAVQLSNEQMYVNVPWTDHYAWSDITGKPSSFTPSAHNHSQIVTEGDNRDVDTTPNDYQNAIKFRGLKSNSYIGSPSNDTYSYLVGLRGWSDSSGGNAHELAFNNDGIFRRQGDTTTWGNWYKLLDSSNYNSYSPSLTGTGASGTWGISISGTANFANQVYDYQSGNGAFFASCQRGIDSSNTGALVFAYGSNPIRFYTNGTEKMRIAAAGNVGIGTDSPSYKLDVVGSIRASSGVYVGTGGAAGNSYVSSDSANNICLNNSSGAVLVCDSKVVRRGIALSDVTLGSSSYPWLAAYATTFYGALNGNASTATTLATPRTIWGQSFDGSSDVSGSITGATTITASGRISASSFKGNFVTDNTVFYCGDSQHAIGSGTDAVLWAYGANSLMFYTNGSRRMTINSEGSVGIGTSSPSQKLHVVGNILASGEVTASSDGRLKTIVGDGNLDINYIANAPNVLFKWNDGRKDDKVHGGSIAQYFLNGASHFVSNDGDYYSLNYGALATSMAISIAKEVVKHEDEITRLKKEVVKLRERVAELEERRA